MHFNADFHLDLTWVYQEPFLQKYWTYIIKWLCHIDSHDLKLWDEYDLVMVAMTFVDMVTMETT